MTYRYPHFIKQNIAPTGATDLLVYNSDNVQIATIPLGNLSVPNTEKLYSFGLISDIHLAHVSVAWNPELKFDAALTYFENQGCSFGIDCGDFTQTGLFFEGDAVNMKPVQFEKYKTVCENHPNLPVHNLCGNHESYVVPITNNIDELVYYTGDALCHTKTQGNDLYIFIGQPYNVCPMSDEALQWLYETLETNRNKRCFVFVHPYIEEDSGDPLDLRENSIFDYWGIKTGVFMDVLRHYKNVVLFHGHSHMKFECQELDISANYTEKNGFKSVHVPSVSRPRDVDTAAGTTPYRDAESQGYTVDVYNDFIVLKGWDFINSKPLPLGTYKIDTPLQTIPVGTFVDGTGTIQT